MADEMKLNHPWMVAVWPGMGNVAISAGYYLMAKLGMYNFAELEASDLFDPDYVVVKSGIIRPGFRPRNRFFVWTDPNKQHDLVVFIGEAQPPVGKSPFCRRLVEYAQQLGVERVFTFAAMATEMHPEQDSRVFAAATSAEQREQLETLDVEILEEGFISGLNGALLGVASDEGLPGTCLLGEIPQMFAQLPFPKASLAVLRIFAGLLSIDIDLAELQEEAASVEQKLGEVLSQLEERMGQDFPDPEPEYEIESTDGDNLAEEDVRHIEKLFEQAQQNRTKAYELKRELDRLNVFKDYEDRFLDLFKN